MRILFLTKYSTAGASSRYRCYQFAETLKARGHQAEFSHLLDGEYMRRLFSGRRPPVVGLVQAFLRRLSAVLKASRYDLVVMQLEAFPKLPTFMEWPLFFFNSNVVLDCDDAWHVVYAQQPLLQSKFPWLMLHSRAVVAGSGVIADYARQFNPHTVMIPTVVDIRKYAAERNGRPRSGVEIAWVGSPVTAKLVTPFQVVWRRICEKFPEVHFKFIGAGEELRLEGTRYRAVPWLEATEAEELATADIGIMPLQDNPFHRGKCALKILQYMAAGLPVVASAIGANTDVVLEGETGFLPKTEEEWVEALSKLIRDRDLRKRMGQRGRERVEQCYSIEAAIPILERVFFSAIAKSKNSAEEVAGAEEIAER
jgi:glycosyltransferase involved in cell wall biosynthesis